MGLSKFTGPILVGFAAFLWATDALFRYPTIESIDPTLIVLIEHALVLAILLPWVLFRYKRNLGLAGLREWCAAIFSGMGGSAIAFVFFTASFLYINPSVAILLQKLQPVLVVLIAYLFLGERPAKKFYFWGLIALGAAIVLSFPDLNFKFVTSGVDLHSKGIQYAAGAAILWAASTVSSKILLTRTTTTLATFWRFFFGLVALVGLMSFSKAPLPMAQAFTPSAVYALLYLSLVPGLFAMLAYYGGLTRTPASVTTFIELLYPIGAVILNTIFLHSPLDPVQTYAGVVLVISVAMISF